MIFEEEIACDELQAIERKNQSVAESRLSLG
jgi:hypothetical protein